MKKEFTKEERVVLCELVFLGNWVVNSHRMPDAQIEKYEKLAQKIAALHAVADGIETPLGDMFDFYMDGLEQYISQYENDCCFPQLAKKLADANFPYDPQATKYYNSFRMNSTARYIYEKEFAEKGISIVSIDIADMDERLETDRLAYKKGFR